MLFFILLGIYITLLNGILIDSFRYKNINIEKLYLKWDNSLNIDIKKIAISDDNSSTSTMEYSDIKQTLKLLHHIDRWLYSIKIDEIIYDDIIASIEHTKGSIGKFSLKSSENRVDGAISFGKDALFLSMKSFIYRELTIDLDIDIKNDNLSSSIAIHSDKNPVILINIIENSGRFNLTSTTDGKFYNIKPIVDIFDLDSEISEWILDRNRYNYVVVDNFSGSFSSDNLSEFLDTLAVSGTLYGGVYRFEDNLEPIVAKTVDIDFSNLELLIEPRDAYFINTPTQNSSVMIDFKPINPILHLNIKTDKASLRGDITHLLEHFDIDLPIKQLQGYCDSSFYMGIDLVNLDIYTKGIFKPTPSLLELSGWQIKSSGGTVELDNNLVSFYGFDAKLQDREISASVSGDIDTLSEKGSVFVDVKQADLETITLKDRFSIIYNIDKKIDTIKVSPSKWSANNIDIKLSDFEISKDGDIFDFKDAAVNSDIFSLSSSGRFNASDNSLYSQTILKRFSNDSIKLLDDALALGISYSDEIVQISSDRGSMWSVSDSVSLLSAFEIFIRGNFIEFDNIYITFGDLFRGLYSGRYNLVDKSGGFHLSNLSPISDKLSRLIKRDSSLELFSRFDDNRFKIDIPSLNAHFQTHPKGWKIAIDDISIISREIPILQQYKIDNGKLNIYYSGNLDRYSFKGEINYPYKLLISDDKPIDRYSFSGNYRDGKTALTVNDVVDVKYSDNTIAINADNIMINLFELIDFTRDTTSSDDSSDNEDGIKLDIYTTNSSLYLNKERKIVSDSIKASLDDGMSAKLYHDTAEATLKMRDGYFVLHGDGFNDIFMKNLLAFSDFKNGSMQLDVKGSKDTFDGVVRIENTILRDYKVLNNALALINTIPNLATFSLPNYNKDGLPAKEIYGYFTYDKNIVNVESFYIDSRELKISGSSIANLEKNSIDGELNLKTTIGSSIGKIPMVGYILLGDDGSISTTLKISGSLDNPSIDTAIAKESVVAPFNILKRAIIYPFKWMVE